ncbi:alpha/beta-hydrolase [Plenodomus tracheiphilus IPT5]|uniref:Alpha/beta-hydrolase n=1 Tax=Plenodomus tracheiphilus IPT5 TaxID=1408161 RepID=A0A6A7APM4_9PLEO|nr:alpha/beta-hydrolase [Plenodomus tracheiphilus IPT5]
MTSTRKAFSSCCLKSFAWAGTPIGHESRLAGNPTYVTGSNTDIAVLYVHDALGWKFGNARLLADHFAKEANLTVYLPDFFNGEILDTAALLESRWQDVDMAGFTARNSRPIREPEIFASVAALRSQGYSKIGAVGYCYGGWGVLRLASSIDGAPPLVDAAVVAHPSWLTNEDFDNIQVPTMILAPEIDSQFPDDMKMHAFRKLVVEKKAVPLEYAHFPCVSHGCMTKGDEEVEGERAAMIKGKDKAVGWFEEWLK